MHQSQEGPGDCAVWLQTFLQFRERQQLSELFISQTGNRLKINGVLLTPHLIIKYPAKESQILTWDSVTASKDVTKHSLLPLQHGHTNKLILSRQYENNQSKAKIRSSGSQTNDAVPIMVFSLLKTDKWFKIKTLFWTVILLLPGLSHMQTKPRQAAAKSHHIWFSCHVTSSNKL